MTPTKTEGPATRPPKAPNGGKPAKPARGAKGTKGRNVAKPTRAPARIDPRINQRRTAVVRQAGRRRRRILLALVVAMVVVLGGWFLLHSKALAARTVTVVGSVHTPAAEIVAQAGLTDHPPLIDVNTGAVAARLEELPWVSTAVVSRHWPDGIGITITERTPVAAVSTTPTSTTAAAAPTPAGTSATTSATTTPAAPSWALLDRTGRVLADATTPPTGLVHLVVPSAPGAPGTDLTTATPELTVAASLPKAFAGQVTEIDVAAGGQVTLKLTSPVTVSLGTTAQLEQKYQDVASLLAGASLTAGDVIDVSVPESPAVTSG